MSYGLQAPTTGWWGNSGSYDVAGPGDNTTAGQTADTSIGGDGWGDFWKQTISQVTNFAIAREAAKSGLAQQHSGGTMPGGYSGGPQYVPRQPEPLGGLLPLLIVGGIVWAVASK